MQNMTQRAQGLDLSLCISSLQSGHGISFTVRWKMPQLVEIGEELGRYAIDTPSSQRVLGRRKLQEFIAHNMVVRLPSTCFSCACSRKRAYLKRPADKEVQNIRFKFYCFMRSHYFLLLFIKYENSPSSELFVLFIPSIPLQTRLARFHPWAARRAQPLLLRLAFVCQRRRLCLLAGIEELVQTICRQRCCDRSSYPGTP